MQSKCRISVVRIGIGPRAGHRSVVDGQELKEILAGEHEPVHHFLQVIEIAYAKIIFRANREYGNRHTGSAPGR